MRSNHTSIVAIVDYGIGNQYSLAASCRQLGYRVLISRDFEVLNQADVLILPGVGAFPLAMENLHNFGLDDYLRGAFHAQRGIIGICLGMQLLTERSSEIQITKGLGFIPGETVHLANAAWHIGWNNIEVIRNPSYLSACDGDVMYFNHSFCYSCSSEYISAVCRFEPSSKPIVSAIQRDHVVGLQFHPEKSQQPGLRLLNYALQELCS